MSFRTIIIKNRMKLDLKLNYMVCRAETETKIFIPEISMLIIESTAVSMTSALFSELIKNDIKIIFCDEKHNPESELLPYYSKCNTSKIIQKQINWNKEIKSKIWTKIIRQKIIKQRDFLLDLNLNDEANLLSKYINELKENDITNREGLSAKVYFDALFGLKFERRVENKINSALNYGYAILLSMFNREIVSSGYLTQLGIWHRNEFNQFNLASDLMEPFRILIDRIVVFSGECDDFKDKILEMFNIKVLIDGKMQYLENAISVYCSSIFTAIENKDISLIRFYE